MKKIFFIISLFLFSGFVNAGQYNGPILSQTTGGLDHSDGYSFTCNIYENHPDIDLDKVMNLIDEASIAYINRLIHVRATVPSDEIYGIRVVDDSDETGGIRPERILLRTSYGHTLSRTGDAARELRELVENLCAEED